MKNIQTEITIHADAATVWKVLTNFQDYKNWNPFISNIEGVAEVGTRLENTMNVEGQKPQVFKPIITELIPEKSFRWLGNLFVKGLFDGEHYFRLEKLGAQKVRLIHGENFSGIMSGMILKMIKEKTLEGFGKMNQALKQEAELIYNNKNTVYEN